MHVVYNGICFTMAMVTVDRQAVYDDSQTDYLYDAVTVEVTGVVSGLTEPRQLPDPPISYTARTTSADRYDEAVRTRPPDTAAPTVVKPANTNQSNRQLGARRDLLLEAALPFRAGNFKEPAFADDNKKVVVLDPDPNAPVLTDKLIRSRLMEPRGQLFVFGGLGENTKELLIHSPGWDRHCDAKNGPHPIDMKILRTHGDAGTFEIQWACVTYQNEQPRTSGIDPLLSNRFSMAHLLGANDFLTIHVEGRAIFDVGKLHQLGNNPDSYRPQLFLPCPQGFVREINYVRGMEGMEGVEYSFTDTQVALSFPAGRFANATAIKVQRNEIINCDKDMFGVALGAMDSMFNRRFLRSAGKDPSLAEKKALLAAKTDYYKAKAKKLGGP